MLLKLMEGAQEGGMGVEGGGVIVSASASVHLSTGIPRRFLFYVSVHRVQPTEMSNMARKKELTPGMGIKRRDSSLRASVEVS